MVRETRYLGDNAERFLPSNRRIRPDDFGEDWMPPHQPDAPSDNAHAQQQDRPRQPQNRKQHHPPK